MVTTIMEKQLECELQELLEISEDWRFESEFLAGELKALKRKLLDRLSDKHAAMPPDQAEAVSLDLTDLNLRIDTFHEMVILQVKEIEDLLASKGEFRLELISRHSELEYRNKQIFTLLSKVRNEFSSLVHA